MDLIRKTNNAKYLWHGRPVAMLDREELLTAVKGVMNSLEETKKKKVEYEKLLEDERAKTNALNAFNDDYRAFDEFYQEQDQEPSPETVSSNFKEIAFFIMLHCISAATSVMLVKTIGWVAVPLIAALFICMAILSSKVFRS